jgi:tRNA (guanine37-N1)-methyltransferase
MKIDVLTLFPELFDHFFNWSIIGRAVESQLVSLNAVNIRDFSENKHKRVDDYPFSGGPGMIMKPEPIYKAIESVRETDSKIIYLSPKGKVYNQDMAKQLSKENHLVLLCGHYEGIDNRIVENYIDVEISIGDYVLTGGELPAMIIIDSIVRLIPGVLSNQDSYMEESHYESWLEYPQYTRPRVFNGIEVPDVLLSGNHEKIRKWKRYQSIKTTYQRRKDLFDKKDLTEEERTMLQKIKKELKSKK